MRYFKSGRIAAFLAVVLMINVVFFGLGNLRAEAGLWDDYKGSIITVAKGFLLLWVINLMRKNATGDGGDDLITSTIKKGLNLDNPQLPGSSEATQPGSGDVPQSEPGEAPQAGTGEAPQARTGEVPQAGSSEAIQPGSSDVPQSAETAEKAGEDESTESTEVVIIEDLQDETSGGENNEHSRTTRHEQRLIELLNQARIGAGLNPLEIDGELAEIARKKARDMIDNDYFDHYSPTYGSPFEMIKAAGIEYSLAGENLAGAVTVEKAFDSLMESTDHRDNILKERYDRIGIGVLEGGPYGLMIVQLFLDSPDPAR